MSVRKAAYVYRIPKSTIHAAFYTPMTPKCHHHHCRVLSDSKETIIASMLITYADNGVPLTLKHVEEAVATFVSNMSPTRSITMPFKNGKPGPRFFRNFMSRHSDVVQWRSRHLCAAILDQHRSLSRHWLLHRYEFANDFAQATCLNFNDKYGRKCVHAGHFT